MKYLVVKPVGGLANRIRVVEASVNFANAYHSQLIIIWEKNFNLNAAFNECFIQPANARIINVDYNGISFASSLKRKFFDTSEAIGRALLTTDSVSDNEVEKLLTNGEPGEDAKKYFDELAGKNKGVFIETCYEFYPNLLQYHLGICTNIKLRAFHLVEETPAMIGVHIRYSQKDGSIIHTPLQKFVEEIHKHLADSPSSVFYLSTDTEEIVYKMKEMFPQKIITGVTSRSRDSKEGIISALIDICCLSQCKKILGSDKSSFSKRAAIIGNIPLQILKA